MSDLKAMISKRLQLRKWRMEDVPYLVKGLNHPDTALRYGTSYPYTEEMARKYIEDLKRYEKEKFAIVLMENNEIIGGCGLHNKNGQISGDLWIAHEYQNQGFGTEASIILVNYCFSKYDIAQMDNSFFEGNHASQKMQEKIGGRILEKIFEEAEKTRVKTVITRERFYKAIGEGIAKGESHVFDSQQCDGP